MTQVVKQFKLIEPTNSNIFDGYSVIKVGIQAQPGTLFKLQGSATNIEIGPYGIYELDVTGLGYLDNLKILSSASEDNPVLVDIVGYTNDNEAMMEVSTI